MSFFSGISKIALSPLVGGVKIYADVTGKTSEGQQALSILTLGVSSAVKGTVEAVASGLGDIFDDN